MKNVIFRIVICVFITFLAIGCAIKPKPAAITLNYKDFPPALQQILDQRIAEVNSNGGVCVAGRVTMSDGTHINSGKDIKVNLEYSISTSLWVYYDGWFVMDRTVKNSSYPGPAKLVLRAFGYDPIDTSIAVMRGEMTYVEFVMQKTPAEKLAFIAGTIVNDQNEPVEGAMVNISFPLPYRVDNGHPRMSINTDKNGHYSFEGLSATEYHLWVPALSGYAGISFGATPIAGETTVTNRKLFQNLSIIIDYVYQADGNRSFTDGNLKAGTVEWGNGHDGMDFSEGKLKSYDPKMLRDLEMMQDQDNLIFLVTYVNGKNGFYDAGEVDLESITEAAESDYSTGAKPCVAGHVYVVKTFEKNYAKFVVRSISVNK
jgi:hypothetical protein